MASLKISVGLTFAAVFMFNLDLTRNAVSDVAESMYESTSLSIDLTFSSYSATSSFFVLSKLKKTVLFKILCMLLKLTCSGEEILMVYIQLLSIRR